MITSYNIHISHIKFSAHDHLVLLWLSPHACLQNHFLTEAVAQPLPLIFSLSPKILGPFLPVIFHCVTCQWCCLSWGSFALGARAGAIDFS